MYRDTLNTTRIERWVYRDTLNATRIERWVYRDTLNATRIDDARDVSNRSECVSRNAVVMKTLCNPRQYGGYTISPSGNKIYYCTSEMSLTAQT